MVKFCPNCNCVLLRFSRTSINDKIIEEQHYCPGCQRMFSVRPLACFCPTKIVAPRRRRIKAAGGAE